MGKVDEVHPVLLLLLTDFKLHRHTAEQQTVHTAVAYHHLWLAHRLQRMHGLFKRGSRNLRVDSRQCSQQALSQKHLAVVGTLGGAAIRRDVRAVGKSPANLLEPVQAQFFELLFVQHVKPLRLPGLAGQRPGL